jgi:hypothetical protein
VRLVCPSGAPSKDKDRRRSLSPVPQGSAEICTILSILPDCLAAFGTAHYARSQSLREIPACWSTSSSSSTPMSPRCGLGMVSTRSPRSMNWCFAPENGPSNCRRRRTAMSCRRHRKAACDPHKHPLLHHFGELIAARFKVRPSCDDAAQARHRRTIQPAVHLPVPSAAQGLGDVSRDHRRLQKGVFSKPEGDASPTATLSAGTRMSGANRFAWASRSRMSSVVSRG